MNQKSKPKLICPYCRNVIEQNDSHGKMIQRGTINGNIVNQQVTCLLVRDYEVEVIGAKPAEAEPNAFHKS